jgi:hypothetical protein
MLFLILLDLHFCFLLYPQLAEQLVVGSEPAWNLLLASVTGARDSDSSQPPASSVALFGTLRTFRTLDRIQWPDGCVVAVWQHME